MPLLIAYEQTKWMENRHDDVQDAPINGDNNRSVEIEPRIGGRKGTKLSDKALSTDGEESSRGTGPPKTPVKDPRSSRFNVEPFKIHSENERLQ